MVDINVASEMRARLFGQDAAIDLISEQIEEALAGLCDEDRPCGVFLLYGPTGTGKTHTIEALAEALTGRYKNYIRVDCGEYQHNHEIAKLIGSPPGYTGHRETQPILTNLSVEGHRSESTGLTIILFDEIEKAGAALRQLLLGILDNAEMRNGEGGKINFRHCLIFMTSNLGTGLVEMQETAATATPTLDLDALMKPSKDAGAVGPRPALLTANGIRNLFQSVFSPEFINRIDALIPYGHLSEADLDRIVTAEFNNLQARIVNTLSEKSFVLDLTSAARSHLLQIAETHTWGARELKRVIRKNVTSQLARMIIKETYPNKGKVTVDLSEKCIILRTDPTATLSELLRASVTTVQWRKRTSK